MGSNNSALRASGHWSSTDTLTLVGVFVGIPGAIVAGLILFYWCKKRRGQAAEGDTSGQEQLASLTGVSQKICRVYGNISTMIKREPENDTEVASEESANGPDAVQEESPREPEITAEATYDIASWWQDQYALARFVEGQTAAWEQELAKTHLHRSDMGDSLEYLGPVEVDSE